MPEAENFDSSVGQSFGDGGADLRHADFETHYDVSAGRLGRATPGSLGEMVLKTGSQANASNGAGAEECAAGDASRHFARLAGSYRG